MRDWLSTYVNLSGGIPSKWTLERVVSLIPTRCLQPLLAQFLEGIKINGTIAIDGKTLRGSRGWNDKSHPLHLLHAWSVEQGICLGQVSVANEITAFPELISQLELKGCIVTTDALNTQKSSAKAVIECKADYIFPVKENHSGLLEDIQLLFQEADELRFCGIDAAHSETIEKIGGRTESRSYTKTHKKPCIKRCENCRQIADRKWHSINSIQCHLRSAIFGVLASFNVGFFMSFGINRNISIFCILDVCVSTIKERYQNAIIIGSEVCMKRKKTRDFLIRNIPLEIFNLLEESAKEHNRSKTQEAIVALATGLTISTNRVRQPKPFKWREKISNQFIERAIDEGHA